MRFLESRVGEHFSGRITGVQPFGLFVQLTDYYVDGLIPIRALTDDYYSFEPENHRLIGRRTGRQLRLADEVESSPGDGVFQGPAFAPGLYFRMRFGGPSAALLEAFRDTLEGAVDLSTLDREGAGAPLGAMGLHVC